MGAIEVGTASWTDRTLLDSGWYPVSADTPEKRLAYYARQFPVVEVDSTYYGPPAEQTTKLWAQRTPDGFTFNIKAFSLLTGHPTKVSAIYKDLRPETDKKNVYPTDLPAQAYEEIWTRFLSALDPLVEAGKLGALLFQFPPGGGGQARRVFVAFPAVGGDPPRQQGLPARGRPPLQAAAAGLRVPQRLL